MSGSTGRKRAHQKTPEEIQAIIEDSDRRIRLDHAEHIYYIKDMVDGVEVERPAYSSSSKVLDMMFPPFDAIEVAASISSRPTSGSYKGLDYAQVLQRWEDGATNGSDFHEMIENYYKCTTEDELQQWRNASNYIVYDYLIDAFLEYAKMMREKGWVPYRIEEAIFDIGDDDPFTRYPPGTADMIYKNADGRRLLVDFKTAETEEAFTKAKSPTLASYPLVDVPSSKLFKGHMQTAVYSALRETLYGEPVETQAIVAFYWGDTPLKWKVYKPPRSLIEDAEKVIKIYKDRRALVYRILEKYGNNEDVDHPYLPKNIDS